MEKDRPNVVTPVIDRPWASGRVLTGQQRERKREVDRISQKRRRKKILERLQDLKGEVNKLRQQIESSPGEDEATAEFVIDPSSFNDSDTRSGQLFDNFTLEDLFAPSPLYTSPTHTYPPVNHTASSSVQTIFNDALQRAFVFNKDLVCADGNLNQDTLIRGVLEGWDAIAARSPHVICPLWEILRLLDRRIFRHSGVITRLCTLRMIHLMLLCFAQVKQFSDLPWWYRPRPCQYRFQHPIAVDILPWPGLRERAVLSPQLTQPNRFWDRVIYHYRFFWPYSLGDAITTDPLLGALHFSSLFESQMCDIQMWEMAPEFFTHYPDARDDMTVFPLRVQLPAANIGARQTPLPLPESDD